MHLSNQPMTIFHNLMHVIPQIFFDLSDNLSVWYASLKSDNGNISQPDAPNI